MRTGKGLTMAEPVRKIRIKPKQDALVGRNVFRNHFTEMQLKKPRIFRPLRRSLTIGGLLYQPFLVDQLLRSFITQTVHQLGVIASIAANKLCQNRGASPGLRRADGRPRTVGDSALKDGPCEKRSAVWRQQVESDRSTTGALTENGHLFYTQRQEGTNQGDYGNTLIPMKRQ